MAATQTQIDKFRKWVVDYADDNILAKVEESDDEDISDAFDDALDEINYDIDPPLDTMFTLVSFPAFGILKLGVLKHTLIGKGIWSARNSLSYSDSGGVNVKAYNQWEKYLPWFERIDAKWTQGVGRLKRKYNFAAGWGSVESEYNEGYYY